LPRPHRQPKPGEKSSGPKNAVVAPKLLEIKPARRKAATKATAALLVATAHNAPAVPLLVLTVPLVWKSRPNPKYPPSRKKLSKTLGTFFSKPSQSPDREGFLLSD
jgi:hypothetical protein